MQLCLPVLVAVAPLLAAATMPNTGGKVKRVIHKPKPDSVEIDGMGVQKISDTPSLASYLEQQAHSSDEKDAKTEQAIDSSHTAEKPSTKSKHDATSSGAKNQGGSHTEGNAEAAATHAKKDAKMSDAKSQGGTHTESKPAAATTHGKKDAKMADTKNQAGAHTKGKPAAAAKSAKNDGASFMIGSIADLMNGGLFRKGSDLAPEATAKKEATAVSNRFKHLLEDEDEEEDVALDELEAMTIAAALNGKHGPAPINCAWTGWRADPSPAGQCSKTCGIGGKKKEIRKKQPEAKYGGRQCEGEPSKWVQCDSADCPTTTTTTTEAMTTTTAGVPRMVDVSLLAYLAVTACAM